MSQTAEEIMNTQDDYVIDDDDYVDDPITLIDYEQARINALSQDFEPYIADESHHKSFYSTSISNDSSCRKSHFVLPVTFFNNSSNLRLLSDCRPLAIKIVDCNKHPWYYRNYIKNHYNPIKNQINSQEDLPSTFEFSIDFNRETVMSLNRSDDMSKMKTDKSLLLNNKEMLRKKIEHLKWRKDIEIKVAFQNKNVTKIDFKKNTGLVGLKITPRIEVTGTALDKDTAKQNDPLKDNKTIIDVDNYILGVDQALNNVGTIIMPVDEESSKNAIKKHEKPTLKSNINKKKKTKLLTENKSKNMSAKKNKEKHLKHALQKIKKHKNYEFKDIKCNLKEIEQSSGVSIVKTSNVKDKKKTNKYINDLLKKALNVIKTLQPMTLDREVENINNSVAELDKEEQNQNNKSHNDIVTKDNIAINESGLKSPLLPCNKLTPKLNSDKSELKKPIERNESLTSDQPIVSEIPRSISISLVDPQNIRNDDKPLIKEIPDSISISKIVLQNTNKDDKAVITKYPNSNSMTKLDSHNTNNFSKDTLKVLENKNCFVRDTPKSLPQNSLNDIVISNVICGASSVELKSSVKDDSSSNSSAPSSTTNDCATAITVATHRNIPKKHNASIKLKSAVNDDSSPNNSTPSNIMNDCATTITVGTHRNIPKKHNVSIKLKSAVNNDSSPNNSAPSNIMNDCATTITVETHQNIPKNHNVSIMKDKGLPSNTCVGKSSNIPVKSRSVNNIKEASTSEKKFRYKPPNQRQSYNRKKSWLDPNFYVQKTFNNLNSLRNDVRPSYKRTSPASNVEFAHSSYSNNVSSSQHPEPLMSKVVFWPYWREPPPPPPPLPPAPPPPPPPRLPQESQYSSQNVPYPVQNNKADILTGKDRANVTENPNIRILSAHNSADNTKQENIHSISTLSNNRPEHRSIKQVTSKSEMYQELEKEMMTIHNYFSKEAPIQKLNDLPNIGGDTKNPLVPVSSTTCQSPSNKLREYRPVPKKFKHLYKNKNNICAHDSKIFANENNMDNTSKNSSLVNKSLDIKHGTTADESWYKRNLNSNGNRCNAKYSTSTLIGTKINPYRHKTSVFKPQLGSLSKINNARTSVQLENETTYEKFKISNGYSPPILPIPTYQNSLEMLFQPDTEPQKIPFTMSNEIRKKQFHSRTSLPYSDNNYYLPPKARAFVSSIHTLGPNGDTNARNKLHSNDKQKINSKKISLEEYKKRTSKMTLPFKGITKKVKSRKDVGPSRTVNFECRGERSKSISQIVNHHLDQDLGYDSDSTIKL